MKITKWIFNSLVTMFLSDKTFILLGLEVLKSVRPRAYGNSFNQSHDVKWNAKTRMQRSINLDRGNSDTVIIEKQTCVQSASVVIAAILIGLSK
jgi:hypothetical protein